MLLGYYLSPLFPFHKKTFVEKFAVRISRGNRVGELGYDIHMANENSVAVYNKLMSIGTDFELQDAGFRAFYSLSCEKGACIEEFYFFLNTSFKIHMFSCVICSCAFRHSSMGN